jgi:hypothetical protein
MTPAVTRVLGRLHDRSRTAKEVLASPNNASIEQVAATKATRAAIAQATTVLCRVRNRLRDDRAYAGRGRRIG